MSVSIEEVINAGGYDLNTLSDAEWLLSNVSEFEELVTAAEDLIEAEEERLSAESEAEYKKRFPEE